MKPFPKPPYTNARESVRESAAPTPEDPFTTEAHLPHLPSLTDDETMYLLKQYLLPSQLKDTKLLKFIMCYLECRNSAQAARYAGMNPSSGAYWRGKPEVHAVLEAITQKAVMKYGYDASEIVERAKEIATLDPLEFQNPDGSFKTHMSEIRPEARRAIKKFVVKNIFGRDANGMSIVIGQIISIEVWDKLKSFELLGSEKNIFKKTTVVEHDVTNKMASLLLESGKRADERKLLMEREVINVNASGTTESTDNVPEHIEAIVEREDRHHNET
jgi:Terminase small subunit